MKRTDFVKNSIAAGAIVTLPAVVPTSVFGKDAPSERAGIGIIACGSRASYAGMYHRYGKSQIIAVCDPRKDRRENFKSKFKCDGIYNDYRELLARKDIDGVHIATPDHWHVPIALDAAKAGKDMYTEKPLGTSIAEDLKAREIVDKYKRVFQYGAQQRSILHVRMGIQLVLNGHIGDVKELYVWAPGGRSGGNPTESPVPEGFDYNLWLGPAPKKPFCKDRVTCNGAWHIYDYAIGFMGGWGAHPMDMLQWWADNAGMKEIPVQYQGTGKWNEKALYNTVTNWDVHTAYASGLKMRFMDDRTAKKAKPHEAVQGGDGTLFVGSEGWVQVSRNGWKTSSRELSVKAKNPGDKLLDVSRDQIQNFVDCILSRKTPVDDLHSAVRSDVATHLSEISIRTGRKITWDPKKETIVGDDEAAKRMVRPVRDWTEGLV